MIAGDIQGQVVVVTGASRGIGKAIAIYLAGMGARVVINYRSSDTKALMVVDEIKANNGEAIAIKADVSVYTEAEELINKTIEEYGQIDILINNAGITRDNLLLRMKEEDWDAVYTTNLKGAFNCSKVALKPMFKKRRGKIINIASIAGLMANPGQVNYSAAKAGMIGMTRSLAAEVASRNITVNAVAPGLIDTEMITDIPEKTRIEMIKGIPLGRLGNPEEIAQLVGFLASPAGDYITGQTFVIDGGLSL